MPYKRSVRTFSSGVLKLCHFNTLKNLLYYLPHHFTIYHSLNVLFFDSKHLDNIYNTLNNILTQNPANIQTPNLVAAATNQEPTTTTTTTTNSKSTTINFNHNHRILQQIPNPKTSTKEKKKKITQPTNKTENKKPTQTQPTIGLKSQPS